MSATRQQGVTLIEAMVTVGIVAILAMVALPDLSNVVRSNRLSGQANELMGALSYARSESASRQQQVAICMSGDQSTCAGSGSWSQGHIIFVDADASGTRLTSGTTEPVLRVSAALEGGTIVTVTGFGATNIVRFRPFGGVTPATAGSIKLCPPSGNEGRTITVPITGRAAVAKTPCP